MKELEAEVWCPRCHHLYGQVFRVQRGTDVWENVTEPSDIPKFCTPCELPIERRRV